MALTFHYSGSIKKEASLSELIAEVKDIAEINGWKYHIYDSNLPATGLGKDTFDGMLYGISFNPTGSEAVWLCFLSNGRLTSPELLQIYGDTDKVTERKNLYLVSTKTQYAGIAAHKIIINLLKYIQRKYLAEFKVYDEGQYWETGDEILLEEIFRRYSTSTNAVGRALNVYERLPNESDEDYFKRILKKKGNP